MKFKYDIIKKSKIYLRRFFIWPTFKLWNTKGRKVFLHNIRLPDDDRDPHDHPWNFWSFVIWGGYTEARYTRYGTKSTEVRRRGDLSYRKASDIHQITKIEPNTWTLIVLGPRIREWGFWTRFTEARNLGRFVNWKVYLKIFGEHPDLD